MEEEELREKCLVGEGRMGQKGHMKKEEQGLQLLMEEEERGQQLIMEDDLGAMEEMKMPQEDHFTVKFSELVVRVISVPT